MLLCWYSNEYYFNGGEKLDCLVRVVIYEIPKTGTIQRQATADVEIREGSYNLINSSGCKQELINELFKKEIVA